MTVLFKGLDLLGMQCKETFCDKKYSLFTCNKSFVIADNLKEYLAELKKIKMTVL